MAKVLARFPRVLEYQSERTLRPRLDFLAECGVAQQDLAKVSAGRPCLAHHGAGGRWRLCSRQSAAPGS